MKRCEIHGVEYCKNKGCLMNEQTIEAKLRNCGREFCPFVPDCDCETCQFAKAEQDELLLPKPSEIDKILLDRGFSHTGTNRNLYLMGYKAGLAKVKQHYEQKKLDRTELREKMTIFSHQCYSQELSACPIHPIFQPQKFINFALTLFGSLERLK